MTNKTTKMIIGAICAVNGLFCACDASAKDLYWEGTNGTWSIGGGGWKLADGTPAIFEQGDNVTFGTSDRSSVTVTVVGELETGDLVFNATNKYALTVSQCGIVSKVYKRSGYIKSARSIQKFNTGTVAAENLTGSWDCPLSIYEGLMQLGFLNKNNESVGHGVRAELLPDSLLGDLTKPHTITIGSADVPWTVRPQLKLLNYGWGPDPYRGYNLLLPTNTPAFNIVIDGGRLSPPTGKEVIGDVILKNGAQAGTGTSSGEMYYNGNLTIPRRDDNQPSEPSKIQDDGNQSGSCFGLANGEPIEIYVDEVTATANEDGTVSDDGKTDFFFNIVLKDTINYEDKWRTNRWPFVASGWVKRGPGTMEFSDNNLKSNYDRAHASVHTGDMHVKEGKVINSISVIWDSSCFGHPTKAPHTVYVTDGATLELCASSYYAGQKTSPLIATVVSNATLKINGANNFGNLEFYGSAQFTGYAGMMMFGPVNVFDLDNPVVMDIENHANVNDNMKICLNCKTRPGTNYVQNIEAGTETTNKFGFAELRLMKCKNHEEGKFADLSINLPIHDHYNATNDKGAFYKWQCGLLKTGDGILDIGYTAKNYPHRYTGETIVEEGGILFQGVIQKGVSVKSGAFAGGKGLGEIKGDLNIEEGGGLLFDASDASATMKVGGTLTLPNAGFVKIYNAGDVQVSEMNYRNIPLPAATKMAGTNDLTGAEWKVIADGLTPRETRNIAVVFSGMGTDTPMYSLVFQRSGFSVIVR